MKKCFIQRKHWIPKRDTSSQGSRSALSTSQLLQNRVQSSGWWPDDNSGLVQSVERAAAPQPLQLSATENKGHCCHQRQSKTQPVRGLHQWLSTIEKTAISKAHTLLVKSFAVLANRTGSSLEKSSARRSVSACIKMAMKASAALIPESSEQSFANSSMTTNLR